MAKIPRPLRILVVDDDKSLNRALEFQLEKAGFLTKAVFDGASALTILEKEGFDLVVLDLVMPGLSGFDVLAEMKQRNIVVPTLVFSMLRQEEDVRRVKELGAMEFIAKNSSYVKEVVGYAERLSVS